LGAFLSGLAASRALAASLMMLAHLSNSSSVTLSKSPFSSNVTF
jgi:hypothetical protein